MTDEGDSAITEGDPVVELLGIVWGSISELCRGFSQDDWARPTACPGWTVQDQLSHLVGPESAFLGYPQPTPASLDPPHVRNALGKANEAAVSWRRSWPPSEVLAEFESVTEQRLEDLREMTEEDLDEESWTPTGPGKYRDLLAVRVFDAWVHEQDMRDAVGRAGHLSGPVAEHSLGRCFLAMPYVVGKKAAAPDGSTVELVVQGPTSGRLLVHVEGGRAKTVSSQVGAEDLSPAPAQGAQGEVGEGDRVDVRVVVPFEAFTRLCCGRISAAEAREGEGRAIVVEGDQALGDAVVDSLPFMI